jgi:hypothetical protein
MSQQVSKQKTVFHRSLSVSEVAHVSENIDVLCEAVTWVRTYLARPHSALGRTGTVCPFAQPALLKDTVRVAVVRLTGSNKRMQIIEAVQYHLEAFLSRSAQEVERVLQATLIMFPDVSPEEAPELIDRTKEELKTRFIQQGLMLGEFHPRNESPGLHNPEFRPLRSPIPMLAIRHMVSTDFVFLNRSEYDAATRLEYLEAYLAVPGLPQSSREEVERSAALLRAELHNCEFRGM